MKLFLMSLILVFAGMGANAQSYGVTPNSFPAYHPGNGQWDRDRHDGDQWGHGDRDCFRDRYGRWVCENHRPRPRPRPVPPRPYGKMVYCSSRNYQTTFCPVYGPFVRSVQLVRQYSNSPCIMGRTFGMSRGGIFVSLGCEGDFLVY